MNDEDKKTLTEALYRAAERGDAETVRRLLAEGAAVNGDDEGSGSPLAAAADEGHAEVMRLLLQHGADADGRDEDGSSALYNAAAADSLEAVRLLLEHGADVAAASGPCWQIPLEAAAGNDNIPMALLLLDHGADINAVDEEGDITALMEAAREDASAEMIDFLLSRGAELEKQGDGRRTALSHAFENCSWRAFDALLAAGANIYVGDYAGHTAMHQAARRGDVVLARILRDEGWSIDREPCFCLHAAAEYGSLAVAELLLEWGASPERRDANGYTPFDLAVACAQAEIAFFLQERGAALTAPGRPQEVPFFYAVLRGDEQAIRAELDAGADINSCLEPTRMTALHLAVSQNDAATLRLLLRLGADKERPACWRETPLFKAAAEKRVEMMRLLLEAGASPSMGEGKTQRHVLTIAAEARCPEALRLLLARGDADLAACEQCWLKLYLDFERGEGDADVVGILVDAGVNPWLHWSDSCSIFSKMQRVPLPEIARELRARGYEC